MQLNTNIDLDKNVMTYTHLTFGETGNYVSQISKKIKYKVTLPEDEGSRVFYAWSAVTCAQTLQDNRREISYQDVYKLLKPAHADLFKGRLRGVTVEKLESV
jgi:hypothetical protein